MVFHCVKRVRIRGYSGPHFLAFEYEEIRSISPHLIRMQGDKDQNNSEYGHFSRKHFSFRWGGHAAQKIKFSIKSFSSKCREIHGKLRTKSHLLEKPIMKNFIFVQWQFKFPCILFFLSPLACLLLMRVKGSLVALSAKNKRTQEGNKIEQGENVALFFEGWLNYLNLATRNSLMTDTPII